MIKEAPRSAAGEPLSETDEQRLYSYDYIAPAGGRPTGTAMIDTEIPGQAMVSARVRT